MALRPSEIKKKLPEYVHKPVLWADEVVGFYPDEQQEVVLANYLANQFTAVKSGHGTGKSCLASVITLHFISTRPYSIVPCTAPSAHQLKDVLWKEHSKWISKSEYLAKTLEWTAEMVKRRGKDPMGIALSPKWHAVARTSRAKSADDTAVGLQGFHAGPQSGGLLYVVDEASGVPETSMTALEGALTEDNNYVYMGGNPTHLSGTFYDAFYKDKALWRSYTLSCLRSKVVDPGYAIRIADKYGIDSDTYRVKVLGEFPLQEGQGLVPIYYIEATFGREVDEVVTAGRNIAGLDVALTGTNNTILYIRDGMNVHTKKRYKGKREDEIAEEAARDIKEFDIYCMNIDAVGPGSGVISHLRKMGLGRRVRGVKGGEKPIGRKSDIEFFNLRAQAFWTLRQLYMNQSISRTYARSDPELRTQLAIIQYKSSAGIDRVQIESKRDMIMRGMSSPDEADADMLCFIDEIGKLDSRPSSSLGKFAPLKVNPWSIGTPKRGRMGGLLVNSDTEHPLAMNRGRRRIRF
jgi:hypothetical protein